MTPRMYIGETFVAKRADDLRLGDEVLVHNISDGLYHARRVVSLKLVGDDVIVNEDAERYDTWETSQGNTVMVLESS